MMVVVPVEVERKGALPQEEILVTERLSRPAYAFQTATEPSKSGSTAILVASNWSAWDCHNAVLVKDITDVAFEYHK